MKKDLYKERAAEMFNVKLEEVTTEQRLAAKQAAYIHIYGVREPLHVFMKKMVEGGRA